MVADFGIAKALVASRREAPNGPLNDAVLANSALTQPSTLVGTPAYMAPEQATHEAPLDHRADLYAWGVVAYELLARRHPFRQSAGAHELLAARPREAAVPLRQLAPDAPVGIADIVMQCLAMRPAERPVSAAAILTACDASAVTSTSRPSAVSRRRLGIGLAVSTLLLIGGWEGSTRHRGGRVLVVASGNALSDISAIQAAVDRGGDVTLQGRFSFAAPPTKPVAAVLASGIYPPAAEILISRSVNIAGVRDAHGEMATIGSGTIPFYVDAPDQRVRIRGLRFVRPASAAILVRAVHGLEISSSRIEGLVPFPQLGEGIAINTHGGMPLPSSPGNPEDVTGQILIANNEIDGTGGRADAATGGVTVFSVGQSPGREVTVDIIGNSITNVSSSAINVRGVGGAVRIVGNTLLTSPETRGDVDAVRLVDARSFLMANNAVESKWPNAAGIQIFSPFAEWPTRHAIIEDNDVLMSPPPGLPLGDFDAAISIRGFADSVVVRHNRISGQARFALSMYAFRGGVPADNTFIDNRLERFRATVADIFIGTGVTRARIGGPGSVFDRGAGTIRGR